MNTPKRAAALVLLLATGWAAGFPAQEWTRFRGPNGTGISTATGMPTTWTEEDFLWRVPIPGVGHLQPVIWGERLFLTTATSEPAIPSEKERTAHPASMEPASI